MNCFPLMGHTHFLSACGHKSVQLLRPAKGVDQGLHAADHITQLHHVLRSSAPGEGTHQVSVDEQAGN